MAGFVSTHAGGTYADACEVGRRDSLSFEFLTQISIDDIDAFARDSQHTGRISGTHSIGNAATHWLTASATIRPS